VAHFIRYFPVYVGRVESQLIGADTLEIRQSVDGAYNRIVQTMFDSLKLMAKMNGEDEDKGQMNFHVILIGKFSFPPHPAVALMKCGATENMHYFVAEIRQQEVGSVNVFSTQAEAVYDENLSAYVKMVLRRPFSKIIVSYCYCVSSSDSVLTILRTTSMVSSNC